MIIRTEIKKLIQQAIKSHWDIDLKLDKIKIDYPPEGFGDYSTNVAMSLAKTAKSNPMETAEDIVGHLRRFCHSDPALDAGEESHQKCPSRSFAVIQDDKGECLFKKVEVIKPGFVNFYLANEYLQKQVGAILDEKEDFGKSEIGKGDKVHIEFISANPTGPVHIGNARGGPFGDVLANILTKAGFKVYKEYYVNDYGNQIEILGHSILGDGKAQYKGEYIDKLKEKILEKNPKKAGIEGAKIILEEIIKPSMRKLGIKFDNWFSERKELHETDEIDDVINILKREKHTVEEDGALWLESKNFPDKKKRVLVKSNGDKTYFCVDIAYHKNKIDRGFAKIIDIWGADHQNNVIGIRTAMDILIPYFGWSSAFDIITTQFIKVIKSKEDIKMSKRAGTYVSIDDLVNEAGRDAVRFFFLMHSPDTHMNFDLDLAKEQSQKNPVHYVQYAHARICSIFTKSDANYANEHANDANILRLLDDESELNLIKQLIKFPEIIEDIARDYQVHHLPHYALDLVRGFHKFYEECKVLDEKNPALTEARLSLVKSVQIVLKNALDLMGIAAPEEM